MEQRRLLIAGIPGMGKTTVGDYLRDTLGYLHINLELAEILQQFLQNPDHYITGLIAQGKHIVVTWGFIPDYNQTALVRLFRSRGFTIVWFDGDREAARRAFCKRGDVPENLFDLQLRRITESKVIEYLNPVVINTFDTTGKHRALGDIAAEILSVMK